MGELSEQFKLGFEVERKRCLFARKFNYSNTNLNILSEDITFLTKTNSTKKLLVGILGEACAYLTTFCPTKIQLNFFDYKLCNYRLERLNDNKL